ncbi:Protein of unknown function DUF1376 [uncultured Caudovirales phage]|uniref:Lin1244/Lin1753-like N-terminal domain-containing protein n=1 Tax=uncultured Caudovirales phage TaxID=2100421 RepID=A0A6J7X7M7_9CAUD|nr:Protein of unknown function DUF1376 [uncultured Caudovirales phage]
MHYFQFEIKEWIANTAHLSLEEEAAYFRLIFYYYDSEKPIPIENLDKVFRKCRIPTELGCYILTEFFECVGDKLWVHHRCSLEIARYQAKQEQASKAGKASAERRLNGRSTDVQPINNHKSLTINHKPKINIPSGIDESLWNDFVILRKAKKLPLTVTAINGIIKEGNKAGLSLEQTIRICCERGWGSFKAEWIMNHAKPTQSNNLAAARSIFGDERTLLDVKSIT